jgi:ATP-dependent DNA helicase RecQ
MKGVPRRYIRELISRLTVLGYVYDDGYLSATQKAAEVLFGGTSVAIRNHKAKASAKDGRAKKQAKAGRERDPAAGTGEQATKPRYAVSGELFAKLKALRLSIAHEESVPAFVIFSDATLVDMCQKHPRSPTELLSVSGVGTTKLARYGERFLQLMCEEWQDGQETGQQEKTPELTAEAFIPQVGIEDGSVQISRVADNANAVLLKYGKPKTSGMKLNGLLIDAGYLEIMDGVKLPTDSGRGIGIAVVQRHSDRGDYMQCLFGADAQRVCIELLSREMLEQP